MALVSPFQLRELRCIDQGSTWPTAFTAANAGGWDAAGVKKRVHDLDFSELRYASVPDPSIQTRHHGHPGNIATLTGGVEQMSLKFKMWLPGGSDTTSVGTVAEMIGFVMGGIKSPTAIADVAENGGSATNIKATGHGQVAGQASLFGTLADGRGDGKVGVIKTIDSANDYTLLQALSGTPDDPDVIKNGHTMWVDPTDESYQDFLLIGHYAGSGAADDPDIINCRGCAGTCTFGGLGPNEKPFVEFTYMVGAWRNEPYATTEAFAHTTAASGSDPAGDRGIGSLTIGDTAATTRTVVRGGNVEIDPGMALEPIMDPEGINGISGWQKVPSETGATMKVTRYWGDMPGLYNDFTSKTAKQILFVVGHAAEATAAFDFPQAYLDGDPTREEFNRMTGLTLEFHGDTGTATALTTADLRLQDAPFRVTLL